MAILSKAAIAGLSVGNAEGAGLIEPIEVAEGAGLIEPIEVAEGVEADWRHCIHPAHALEVRRHLLEDDAARDTASLFGVLADPTRLQALHALLHAPTGELCVRDLAAGMGRDDTTISHQLRVLRNQHIVAVRKVGRIVYYRLVDQHIRQLLGVGLSHASEPRLASVPNDKEAAL